jgi:phosphoribosylformylglycinamidine (FGAM) synthase-like amidotransferase family enzyme
MSDLLESRASLADFRGVIFVGGFSYGDVLDSAKGWAGAIRFNPSLWQQFQQFYERPDTFSLGVCNGCQLMALLGWVRYLGANLECRTTKLSLGLGVLGVLRILRVTWNCRTTT